MSSIQCLKAVKVFSILVISLVFSQVSNASGYDLPKIEKHLIKAKHIDQTFEIYVMVPAAKKDGSERFPALYITDSYSGMRFGDVTQSMQMGAVPRYITVGIGYKGIHGYQAGNIRERDLSFKQYDWMGKREGHNPAVKKGKMSGGAPEFLAFIRDEVMPFVDAHYPTDPDDRGYFGFSLGGGFGLYTLFNHPETFNRYIIGSPTISFSGDDEMIKAAKRYIASGKPINAKVFMSVGNLEDTERVFSTPPVDLKFVRDFKRLRNILQKNPIPGMELTTHIFEGQSHLTVPSMAYVLGVETVYGWIGCDDQGPFNMGVRCAGKGQ